MAVVDGGLPPAVAQHYDTFVRMPVRPLRSVQAEVSAARARLDAAGLAPADAVDAAAVGDAVSRLLASTRGRGTSPLYGRLIHGLAWYYVDRASEPQAQPFSVDRALVIDVARRTHRSRLGLPTSA